ncbi:MULTISPECIES: lipopolysaccharide biosynthesis protein [unclassified Sphingomonas]|jgi:O-antigen/teichoic acid export membrane protein|uniref:lipopolysaccharide biosynthesis protein n=1 Tax=unclassified Sphingomonas TaxID=196159 RepID=UPI0006FEBD54|nr:MULTISPECIES: lipopolysaccharide biosynthesis protein [unclassified Sphingomonas]KQM28707.1 polysaccharide biosynthesis protein [Sphingomonas sp. Leaf9]KQM45410.1 polysaccharide biosynthesis protein [Sphingomonas sp. Leaf11]KQM86193.1 polysaccharide biosynthesis protein [Sphingomonas sp. Leaf23]
MTDAPTPPTDDIAALAKGGRTNVFGFVLRLVARLPFLFIAGRIYGPEIVGRFALAVLVVELAALVATLGLKRGLAQALSSTDRPHAHVVWDALAVAFILSVAASAVLFVFPQIMYPNSEVIGFERLLPLIVFAIAWSDVSLAALAYRLNVKAAVTARAVVEPWTISIAAWAFSYYSTRDGLIMSYVLAMAAALVASIVPFIRSYGLPYGWSPHLRPMLALVKRNMPLAGADAIEWGTRNVDRFILGLLFGPAIVGIYYMAQQVASLPQKLKTSFDPVLGPVITQSLAADDKAAVARQVRQVGFWIITAQAALALAGSIPATGVMGVVGREFVSGAAALSFLLVAEVLAAKGAVSEAALVYIARHRNLMLSIGLLSFQVVLSFALVFVMRSIGLPQNYAATGPAMALCLSVALGSILKSGLLSKLLGHNVRDFRPAFLWAVLAATIIGVAIMELPKRFEWAEMLFGIPIILATYFAILWRWAFRPEDKALFHKSAAAGEATIPTDRFRV